MTYFWNRGFKNVEPHLEKGKNYDDNKKIHGTYICNSKFHIPTLLLAHFQ